MNSTDTAEREIAITRIIKAPRELVFEVWTKPEHVIHWWGPTGFTNTIHEMTVKPGGVWRFIMHGPDGVDYPNKIVFRKIVAPELLEFSHGQDIDNDPNQFEVTVTFKAIGKTTELYMRMLFKSKAQRDMVVDKYGAIEGNRQTMMRLEEYLSNLNQ